MSLLHFFSQPVKTQILSAIPGLPAPTPQKSEKALVW
jgi:hypothetical protein